MINEPYLDEDGRVEHPSVPDDYELTCNATKDAYFHDDNMGLQTGGSLQDKYDNYHTMAIQCGEEPVGMDEWLNN